MLKIERTVAHTLAATTEPKRLVTAERAGYESPELVKVDAARKLLLGHTYTENYRDWGGYGTTRYGS